jgi:molybdate transport system substrate-binding protein
MRLMKTLTGLMAGCLMLTSVHAEPVHVAVAANFTAAMKDIAAQFEQNTGHKVVLSFGSSGKLFAQIQHGAPFEVFLSADQAKPRALQEAGMVADNSRFTYAIGALALWSREPGFVDDKAGRLRDVDFHKLALANPRLAPYGAAAVEVLESMNLVQETKAKWVMGENIAQTYQFTASGNADLGFVALSQIMAEGHIKGGSSWIVPADLYEPIRQDAVLLKSASEDAAAKALLAYLKGDEAKAIIESYGYKTD